MRFSMEPHGFATALRVLQRRRQLNPRQDVRLRIKAKADGVILETNLCSAFVPAQVVLAGACEVDRATVERVIGWFPRGKAVSAEIRGDLLYIGRFGIKTTVHFLTRENERYPAAGSHRSAGVPGTLDVFGGSRPNDS